MHVPRGRVSVLLWRRCDTLCTSGFVDDVTFGRDGPYDVIQHRGRSVMSMNALLWFGLNQDATSECLCKLMAVRRTFNILQFMRCGLPNNIIIHCELVKTWHYNECYSGWGIYQSMWCFTVLRLEVPIIMRGICDGRKSVCVCVFVRDKSELKNTQTTPHDSPGSSFLMPKIVCALSNGELADDLVMGDP